MSSTALSATPHLPSLQAFRSPDDQLLVAELRLLANNRQLAIVRAIADELEWCVAHADPAARTIREQLAHELERLGCRAGEFAAVVANSADIAEASGVHRVFSPTGDASASG